MSGFTRRHRQLLTGAGAMLAIIICSGVFGTGPGSQDNGRSTPAGYASCADAADAGATPLHLGEPGYTSGLDPDGNGVACD